MTREREPLNIRVGAAISGLLVSTLVSPWVEKLTLVFLERTSSSAFWGYFPFTPEGAATGIGKAFDIALEVFFYSFVALPVYISARWIIINLGYATLIMFGLSAIPIYLVLEGRHISQSCKEAHLTAKECAAAFHEAQIINR